MRNWFDSTWVARGSFVACLLLGAVQPALAAPISWTDWTTASPPGQMGTASGVIASAGITVSYTGQLNPGAQTNGGTNFWIPNVYTSAAVDNPPPDSDILRLIGGSGLTQTITFSEPVQDPVMAIVSLGGLGIIVTYHFDAPFDVLSFGPGFFNGPGTLTELPGNVLRGDEGHGTIRFNGTFTSISFTVPTGEFWHGFTVGIAEQQIVAAPEPATWTLFGLGCISALGYGWRLRPRGAASSRS